MGTSLNTRTHGNLGQFPPVPHSRSGESEVERERGSVGTDAGPQRSRSRAEPRTHRPSR